MTQAETTTSIKVFEPTIIVFACNWCSYAGADLAGVSRLKYPSNIRIVRVMCSGRVDPAFVMKAFLKGADGVMVAGCHPGDCHYLEGNLRAKERIDKMVEAMKILGFEKDRFRLEWISASEGKRFAQIMTEFTEQVRTLGPIKKSE
ncbi:methyl-viologen-reducing hydrogenase subunit delta [Candidatus Heimdallarchaeota archaeon B3_Heim]|nr:MAG: methyl-viologen-reducing hydrogenase subunit delta [Candidatus Heimdallarchaeota archaeon B3_Heim]